VAGLLHLPKLGKPLVELAFDARPELLVGRLLAHPGAWPTSAQDDEPAVAARAASLALASTISPSLRVAISASIGRFSWIAASK
jgi:hypothetical protein